MLSGTMQKKSYLYFCQEIVFFVGMISMGKVNIILP